MKVIAGGSWAGPDVAAPNGRYRSSPKLESFMRDCGVRIIIEQAADPRGVVAEPEKVPQVISDLNQFLARDGLDLPHQGQRVRLGQAGTSAPVLTALAQKTRTIDLDTVRRDLERAMASAATDPEDAVTAACSAIENACRSVLTELGVKWPDKRDILSLCKAVSEPLALSPGREDLPAEVAEDVRQVLDLPAAPQPSV